MSLVHVKNNIGGLQAAFDADEQWEANAGQVDEVQVRETRSHHHVSGLGITLSISPIHIPAMKINNQSRCKKKR
jgi:hypothetical protein